ncbi:hypothetical protein [Mesoaciditoga sp.]
MNNQEEDTPFIFKIIIILIIVSAIFGAFMGVVNLSLARMNSKEIGEVNSIIDKSINAKISRIENEISSIDTSLRPGGMIDLYINAYHYLSNSSIDLQKIVTIAQSNYGKTFFSIYITGKYEVWIGVMKNGKYVFQSEMTPGISDQRFFVNSTPTVSTSYTITLNSSSVLMSGDPQNTYVLLVTPDGAQLLKMSSKSLSVGELIQEGK